MSAAGEAFVAVATGPFRLLHWPGSQPGALFLHGLSGTADVWGPTIEALGPSRPLAIAIDQRGHGQSPQPAIDYRAGDFAADVVELLAATGLNRPHLVGHSMGARIAIVLGARYPSLFRSVSIVDIGPEASIANARETIAAFDRMPVAFPDADAALASAGRSAPDPARRAIYLSRFQPQADGSLTLRANVDALKQTVQLQRARNYWREWERLRPPALYVRGGRTHEVNERVASEMRRRNPLVRYEVIPDIGHNIPLLAPDQLASLLSDFWATTPAE
ncbi:hypothetical protein AYO38_04495 [bacterium SCGC AG-212-C10]|nr:hypothetical protein AYO38_04495 [bacterium SCGC AG-212-C10]